MKQRRPDPFVTRSAVRETIPKYARDYAPPVTYPAGTGSRDCLRVVMASISATSRASAYVISDVSVRAWLRATRSARSRNSSSNRSVNGFLCVTVASYVLRCADRLCMTSGIFSQGVNA